MARPHRSEEILRMALPEQITSQPFFLLIIPFVGLAVAQYWWRYTQAKTTAEDWLRRHHYRARELDMPWFRGPMFAPSWGRNSNNAFVFRAVIDDVDLGGTGSLWLRVWTTWLGGIDNEVEVVWDEMPDGRLDGSKPLFDRIQDVQLSLLRRVASGEAAFYSPRHPENGGGPEFDATVEHLMALSRRGMLTCDEPQPGKPGQTQYSRLSNVALTEEGRAFLASKKV
jgi:hypothetical protein